MAAAAATIGMELRPTEVLIFGNPRAGTRSMQAVQTVGIDLPLKALVWQDEDGTTWLAYNDPQWLAHRHGVDAGLDGTLHAMADALAAVAREATAASIEKRGHLCVISKVRARISGRMMLALGTVY
jgi:uncharacterized protein (DUF302 family)